VENVEEKGWGWVVGVGRVAGKTDLAGRTDNVN